MRTRRITQDQCQLDRRKLGLLDRHATIAWIADSPGVEMSVDVDRPPLKLAGVNRDVGEDHAGQGFRNGDGVEQARLRNSYDVVTVTGNQMLLAVQPLDGEKVIASTNVAEDVDYVVFTHRPVPPAHDLYAHLHRVAKGPSPARADGIVAKVKVGDDEYG